MKASNIGNNKLQIRESEHLTNAIILLTNPRSRDQMQCCGSGSGIRCLFDPWIRDPEWVFPDPGSQTHIFESLLTIIWVKSSIIL